MNSYFFFFSSDRVAEPPYNGERTRRLAAAAAEGGLRLQDRPNWRLGGRKITDPRPIRSQRVLIGFQGHHRRRVPNTNPTHPPQDRQGSDLGHSRPGKVISIHFRFLQTLVGYVMMQ